MNLIENGKLTFPLYHQTSSAFIGSIKEFGFCGINIIKKMEVLESLEKLISYADKNEIGVDPILRIMLNQKYNERINFRHGGGYVTPSKYSAVRYATGNIYGSELISNVMVFIESIINKGHEIDSMVNKELMSLRSLKPLPVLLEIKSTPIAILRGEKNESFDTVINRLSNIVSNDIDIESKMFNMVTQQTNFEVLSKLNASTIEFYKINFNHPIDSIFPVYSLEKMVL